MQSARLLFTFNSGVLRVTRPLKTPRIRSTELDGAPRAMSCSVTTGVRSPIVLFGDSITQQAFAGGWGSQLSEMYVRRADVLNRGLSGYNTTWALLAMKKCLVKGTILLTIFFGANDCALPDGTSSRQHVPIPQYKSNIESMVALARSAGIENILLITPPPIDEEARVAWNKNLHGDAAKDTPERSNVDAGQYAEACKEVAAASGVSVVDLWQRLQEHEDWKLLLNDGLHLSDLGNKAVFDEVKRVLDAEMPSIAPDVLPLDLPLHGDLTHDTAADVLSSYLPTE